MSYEEGQGSGVLQGLALALEIKFGAAGMALVPALKKLDLAALQSVRDAIRAGTTLEELQEMLDRE